MRDSKDASRFTSQANKAVRDDTRLHWDDPSDFDAASRGHIASLDPPVIRDAAGRTVWDMEKYAFIDGSEAPPTVNPSLWRQARLNNLHGLFKVTDGIYQARGHDLSVMSFVETRSGYIVIDPLISAECASASLDMVYQHVGRKPVIAVIYTHSHIDHWGGVKGVVTLDDVNAGRVQVIAPEGFTEAAISENVMAGNVMGRRASYMYGSLLEAGPRGQVDAGLGKATSTGTVTLIEPTVLIEKTPTEMTVDGVDIVFQLAPDTEAPSEMHFHFPASRALCIAENCTHNLHNLYTLRGAKVRDAKAWAHYIDEAIDLFADETDVVFASHHWPTWGSTECTDFLKKQRNMYKFIHDEVLRLANNGYTMLEVAEGLELPDELASAWYNRGYYGSVSHDAKAVYQRYLGWFDGNPANLHPLPPEEASKYYVEFMGGPDAVLDRAVEAFGRGEYRWVAQVVNHVVFADPENRRARELQADTLEQLGYQAESGPWRNFYLTGALELRKGVSPVDSPSSKSADVVVAMSLDMIFDYMAVLLNGAKAAGKSITINMKFTDIGQDYVLRLENSVLNHSSGKQAGDADATLVLTRAALNEILIDGSKLQEKVTAGELRIEGHGEKFGELFSLMDTLDPAFNIVTP